MSTKLHVKSRSLVDRIKVRHLLGTMALAMLILGGLMNPRTDERFVTVFGTPIPAACGLRVTTGYPCPSCGLTRSVCYSVRGQIGQAIELHPLGPVVTAVAVLQASFMLLSLAVPRVARLQVPIDPVGWAYGALVGAILIVGIVRILGLLPWPPL